MAGDQVAVLLDPSVVASRARRAALARALGGTALPGDSPVVLFVPLRVESAAQVLAGRRAALRALCGVRDLAPVLYLAGNPRVPMVPTGDVIVRYRRGATAGDRATAARTAGLYGMRRAQSVPRAWVFDAPSPEAALRAPRALRASGDVAWAQPDLLRVRAERATPNDPLFSNQWHLLNTGQGGGTFAADAHVTPAWDTYRGSANEVVAIVDDGLEVAHADLAANVLPGQSWDFETNDGDPSPSGGDDHGTACGGVAAARGFNGVGVSGVAPQAGLVGYKMLDADTDANEAAALTRALDVVDIMSSSWGPVDDRHLEGPGSLTAAALQQGVTNGRGGLGTIYVWAGGNGRQDADNVNFDGYANSRYTIAVGASTNYGAVSYYSEDGAPLIVTAPSNGGSLGITTVDRTGGLGYSSGDYTSTFGGTSSACPLVAGAVALMLQANPQLGWRDVPAILMSTAAKNDPGDADWKTNGAGHHVNHKYGFGRVDVAAAVAAAAAWEPLGPELTSEATGSPGLAIPDNSATGVSHSLVIPADIRIEWVDVWFTAAHSKWTQLEVVLTSPDGSQSVLANAAASSAQSNGYDGWRLGSARHFGESSQGTWTLTVRDRVSGTTGTFTSWRLKVYGTAFDTSPPTTTMHGYDGSWRQGSVTVQFDAVDDRSGVAATEYRVDGRAWTSGTDVTLRTWRRGGNSREHLLEYRSRDNAGNLEAIKSVPVRLDSRAPITTSDAPTGVQSGPVTVNLAAADPLSGVASTWYSVNGAPFQQGTHVGLPGAPTGRTDWIAYYSVDLAGNVEYRHWASVSF